MEEGVVVCHSCGKKVECVSGEPPCEVLTGWLVVCQWKGLRSIEQYSFCSLSCLKGWVDTKIPKIPETFLKSFGEENGKE
jgi:hypothetical protein